MTDSITDLDLTDCPRDADGVLHGQYRLRWTNGGRLEEVGDREVTGLELDRMSAAYGHLIAIEPADRDTAHAVARHVYETTGDGARAKALRALFRSPRKRKAASGGTKSPRKGRKTSASDGAAGKTGNGGASATEATA